MHLFSFPSEIVHLIFRHIVFSREFPRVMRIRLVNRLFKNYIDDAIFRLRFFSQLIGAPYWVHRFPQPTGDRHQGWLSYVHSYLAYQASREQFTTSWFGRIHRIAQALCEQDSDTGSESLSTCLNSLIPHAAKRYTGRFDENCPGSDSVLQEPTAELRRCSDLDLKADIFVAAVFLGKKAYVERQLSDGTISCITQSHGIFSPVFGGSLEAAVCQGDLEMVKLVLSCAADYNDTGTHSRTCQHEILRHASAYGHRAAFNFALDMRPMNLPETETERKRNSDAMVLEVALQATPWPDNYERAAAILGPDSRMFSPSRGLGPIAWLNGSAASDKVEMVRHFLSKGVTPNPTRNLGCFNPLLSAVRNRNETITRILLDAGADPNLYPPPYPVLTEAVWKGSIAIVKLLLDHGADVNGGCPPPIVVAVFKEHLAMFRLLREHGARLDTPETGGWAMSLVRLHGLHSMVDLLTSEGVGKDVILHRVGRSNENEWYERLWPLWAQEERERDDWW